MPVASPKSAAMANAVQAPVASPKSAAMATPVSGSGVVASPSFTLRWIWGSSNYGQDPFGSVSPSPAMASPAG